MLPCSIHDMNDVIDNRFLNMDVTAFLLEQQNLRRTQNRFGQSLMMAVRKPFQNFFLCRRVGIANFDPHHEPIHL